MKNKIIKKLSKPWYALFGVTVLLIAVAGSAYAYYQASISSNAISGTAAGPGSLQLTVTDLSTSATGNLIPMDSNLTILNKAALGEGNTSSNYDSTKQCIDKNGYTACKVYQINLKNNGTTPLIVTGGVTELSGANTPNLTCTLMSDNHTVTTITDCVGSNTLANRVTINAGVTNTYFVMVYINNLGTSQTDSGTFNGTVEFNTGSGGIKARFHPTAEEKIESLFTKTGTVTEDPSGSAIVLDVDTNHSLMKDLNNNIRYYGANPNNYIDLGEVNSKPWERFSMFRGMFENSEQCYATADCNTNYAQIGQLVGMTFTNAAQCNAAMPSILANAGVSSIDEICGEQPILWRIIGIVDGKVKLIRNESIGVYSWDTSDQTVNYGYGINEWSQSDSMKLLNPGYENASVNNSLYYNSGSGYCYNGSDNSTDDCDFTSIGIKDSAIKNLIANATYYTGGWNSSSVYPNFMLEKERGTTVVVPGVTCTGDGCNDNITRTTTWTGRIALPYPSDYGYAADLSQCNQNLQSYDDSICITNNWMTGIGGMWLLTPRSGFANDAWSVLSSGGVYSGGCTFSARGVVPVLYLTSDALIESGSGTEGDPYTLAA